MLGGPPVAGGDAVESVGETRVTQGQRPHGARVDTDSGTNLGDPRRLFVDSAAYIADAEGDRECHSRDAASDYSDIEGLWCWGMGGGHLRWLPTYYAVVRVNEVYRYSDLKHGVKEKTDLSLIPSKSTFCR